VLLLGGRVVVGFVPKERMDRMGMPADIFAALEKAGFCRKLLLAARRTQSEFDELPNQVVTIDISQAFA
jgi:hypothetical protein